MHKDVLPKRPLCKDCYPVYPLNLHLEIYRALQTYIAVDLGEAIDFLISLELEIPIYGS